MIINNKVTFTKTRKNDLKQLTSLKKWETLFEV